MEISDVSTQEATRCLKELIFIRSLMTYKEEHMQKIYSLVPGKQGGESYAAFTIHRLKDVDCVTYKVVIYYTHLAQACLINTPSMKRVLERELGGGICLRSRIPEFDCSHRGSFRFKDLNVFENAVGYLFPKISCGTVETFCLGVRWGARDDVRNMNWAEGCEWVSPSGKTSLEALYAAPADDSIMTASVWGGMVIDGPRDLVQFLVARVRTYPVSREILVVPRGWAGVPGCIVSDERDEALGLSRSRLARIQTYLCGEGNLDCA
eukprot:g37371.t1